jgi:hypothetical protein
VAAASWIDRREHASETTANVMLLLAPLALHKAPVSISGPQPWRTATVDYSAANEYISTPYPHLHPTDYFDGRCPSTSGAATETIFDGRKGVYDDTAGDLKPASLASCGFALLKPDAARVSDWTDADAVRATYLPALRKLITQSVETSHGRVSHLLFWHMLIREEDAPYVGPSDASARAVCRGPIAALAHVDTDVNAYADQPDHLARIVLANEVVESGRAPFGGDLPGLLAEGRRFCILNSWCNADNEAPIQRAPLAILAAHYRDTHTPTGGRFPEHTPDRHRSRWYDSTAHTVVRSPRRSVPSAH